MFSTLLCQYMVYRHKPRGWDGGMWYVREVRMGVMGMVMVMVMGTGEL